MTWSSNLARSSHSVLLHAMTKALGLLALFLAVVSACWADERIDALRKKAEQGNAEAQFSIGLAYAAGNGVPKDPVEAIKWWQKSAVQGDAKAQLGLGLAYAAGAGVIKDPVESAQWYRKAAEQGFAEAQFNLGVNYYNGDGVLKDLVEAHAWWNIAGVGGYGNAQENRYKIEKEMTKEQIAEATKRAKEIMAAIKK